MMIQLPRAPRAQIAYCHDIVMAALSFAVSLWLRLGADAWQHVGADYTIGGCALFTVVAAGCYLTQRMYAGVWRYASVSDLLAITRAVTLTVLVFLPLMFLFTRLEALPRSVMVINWFVLMTLLGGPRFLYRIAKDRRVEAAMLRQAGKRIPVLLVGAGDESELFIRAMQRNAKAQYQVVGIVGVSDTRVGRHIHGVEVLGSVEQLEVVVETLDRRDQRPERVVLTSEELSGTQVRSLLERTGQLGLSLARVPRLTDFREGLEDKLEVRAVALEDLLGRPQAVLDRDGMRQLIAGRTVLVTGAGGSIGSELVRQICALGPARLLLLDNCEFNLYSIDMEVSKRHGDLSRAAFIADVRDRERLHDIFSRERPELVFHAAALKHVPIVEDNPLEGIRTNTLGTANVADCARANDTRVMVLISTDKAVNPTNVMGATKRMAECYCQAMDVLGRQPEDASSTRFVTVRFGNVLGSTGSVVPLFQRQLAEGGPLTVTHPDITRFFMTIREAVELVLQASALGTAAEHYAGKIFVLDMGEPVRIADLARQMIRLAGLRLDDVKIEFVGLRPGEKLYEEIFHGAEAPLPTEVKGILVAGPRAADHALLRRSLDEMDRHVRVGARIQALEVLATLVPEYDPHGSEGAIGQPRMEAV